MSANACYVAIGNIIKNIGRLFTIISF